MGRPCCEKVGMKKGPWTPEEDIILVTYIQDHGPGNWRAVPTNTGLLRCSKSCRLRWTNYLRPGIKRGNFTDQEEKLIIHLQALLGNRWSAIASYLPKRTDNDIKNYWNTHLKKKLRKLEANGVNTPISKGQWERRLQNDIQTAKQTLSDALSFEKPDWLSDVTKPSNTYASSTENISRLLEGWIKKSPKPQPCHCNSGSTRTNKGESVFSMESVTSPESSKDSSEAELPMEFLETWLFDDGIGHGEELADFPLDDC